MAKGDLGQQISVSRPLCSNEHALLVQTAIGNANREMAPTIALAQRALPMPLKDLTNQNTLSLSREDPHPVLRIISPDWGKNGHSKNELSQLQRCVR